MSLISSIKFFYLNFSKKSANYIATISSVYTKVLLYVSENPAPGGKSTNTMLDNLFQEYSFFIKWLSFILKGPFSKKTEISDEHHGPPVSHNTNGASKVLFSQGKYQ